MGSLRIIGLGNSDRGDDAVGILAARRLRDRLEADIDVVEAEGMGVEVADLVAGADGVILIDAARSGRTPGTVLRFNASTGPIAPLLRPHSTHAISAGEALELARALGTLPRMVIVYAIEAAQVEIGRPLSPAVSAAVTKVVSDILREIAAMADAGRRSRQGEEEVCMDGLAWLGALAVIVGLIGLTVLYKGWRKKV